MSQPLFRRVLGADFETLPAKLKALHAATGRRRYHGHAEVLRGSHPLARLLAWATHLPPAGQCAVEVEIQALDGSEKWIRQIGGRSMPSRLWEQDGLLFEQLGLARFGFSLTLEQGVIVWRVARVSAVGLSLPARWFGKVVARESQVDGRYRFDVAAALPMIGLLVHYRGWLHVE